MSNLSRNEKAALAMHEIMKREQEHYRNRIDEQRQISNLSDEALHKLVAGMKVEPKHEEENKE